MSARTQVEGAERDVFQGRTVRELACWGLAAGSAAAAAIHFSVIGEHYREMWYFGVFFAAVAWAQIAWAVGVVTRPRRRVLLAGAALQAALVVIYVWSRTTGLPIGATPWQPESVAFLDVLCTTLEVLVAGGAVLLVSYRLDRPVTGRVVLATLSAGFIVVAATTSTALAVAGTGMDMASMGNVSGMGSMTETTGHSSSAMGSMEGSAISSDSTSMSGMSGSTSSSMGDMSGMSGSSGSSGTTMAGMPGMGGSSATTMPGMNMPGSSTTMPGMGDGPFMLPTTSPAGDIMWPEMAMTMEPGMEMAGPACTTTPTAAQQAAAVALVNQTVAATAKYRSLAAAKADGYVPITPTGASVVHYINFAYLNATQTPSEVLNTAAVQSLVYANTATGPRLAAAMYVMPNGSTATPPDPGGCLTLWHLHTNLCFNSSHIVVGVVNALGNCPAGSVNEVTQPMMHVWLAPIAGGPLMVDAPDAKVVTAASSLPAADPPPERA